MSALPRLTVIEASAGTGKTHALVERLVSLMADPAVAAEPERIAALTFSRAAAGEIFNRFIDRLAAGAESGGPDAPLFAALLRKTISRQHLSAVGTLDGFLLRMLKAVPFEAGLAAGADILGEHRAPAERSRILDEIFAAQSEEAKETMAKIFDLSSGSQGAKSFAGAFSDFVSRWHPEYCERPGREEWGCREAIWGGSPPPELDATPRDVRAAAKLPGECAGRRGAGAFAAKLASWSGGTVPETPAALRDVPAAVRAARLAHYCRIAKALDKARGIRWLAMMYEEMYSAEVRGRGRVTFDDVPRLLNALEPGAKAALEYRMDARWSHWAIDEFQDTNRAQWKAVANLLDECMQPDVGDRSGGSASVFAVGDPKQSIYGWRGGDPSLLANLASRARLPGNLYVARDKSYRFGPAIAGAVNSVFRESNVNASFDFDGAPEGAGWSFNEHECAANAERRTDGYVEVVQAAKSGRRACIGDFFEPIYNALDAVRPWERGLSAAILTRSNGEGAAIAAHLKERGMTAVAFEGDGSVLDTPVLEAFLDTARLAAHPGDARAFARLARSPLAKPLGIAPCGAAEAPAEAARLAASLLDGFTRHGLERKFRELREALKDVPEAWNVFTESRFAGFLGCAAEFDRTRDASEGIGDFAAFAAATRRRDRASEGIVRIMTMHHSKGLGFDFVIIPFYEDRGVGAVRRGDILSGEGATPWIMPHPGEASAMADPVLAAAERARKQKAASAALSLAYVAMTRAKLALTVILHPLDKKGLASRGRAVQAERISDLVRNCGLQSGGDRSWYLKYPVKTRETQVPPPAPSAAVATGKLRERIVRVRPSDPFYDGMTADLLFDRRFGSAARKGVEIHEKLAAVEWLDIDRASTPLEEAFVKPSPDATLWREKKYELFIDGKWETGQFDRVVFTGSGDGRKATIYDFKSNALCPGESEADFFKRLSAAYAGQMAAYKRALTALTGIPAGRIETKLVFTVMCTAGKQPNFFSLE